MQIKTGPLGEDVLPGEEESFEKVRPPRAVSRWGLCRRRPRPSPWPGWRLTLLLPRWGLTYCYIPILHAIHFQQGQACVW